MSATRRQTLITAHAGCMGTVPNSRESFVAAFASKADIVEADIRSTRDGVAVLTHDDCLSMGKSASLKVADLAWGDIRELAGSGRTESIMRLETYLDLAAELEAESGGGRHVLNLDIKEPSILGVAASVVRERNLGPKVLFSGLEFGGLEEARARLSGLRYLFNADALLPHGKGREEDWARVVSIALEFGCAGVNLEWTKASPGLLRAVREAGFPAMLWTVDRVADMKAVLALEPDSITTNRPDILAALLGRG